jgi:hypothetical protein
LADLLLTKAAWPQISAQMYTVVRNMPVEAHVSSALGALRAGRDVPVRLDIHSANESVSAVGTIADMRKPERTPLDVEIRVTSLKRSPWKPGEMKLPDIPFSATGNVSVGGELITLDDLKLKAGETDFSGNVRLHRGQRLNLAADLSGNVLDLRPWIPKSEAKVEIVEKTEKVEKVEKATKSDPRMDQPFDLEPMRKMDVALTLHARRVISYRSDLDDLALNAKLNEGMLDVSTAIAQGGSTLKARVDGRTDAPAIAIRFKTKDLDFESLTAASTATAESSPKLTVNAQFASSGATPRKIYSSAKGVAVLSAGSGRINTSSASPFLLQTLSASLLEVLLPGRKPDDFDQLECAAARFEVKDGVANSPNGIALRFKRMDILGSGAVNLTTGKILFGFKAVRRRWFDFSILSIASDFASITGTVEKPRVGLDTQGVLITGGAAWATAGLSLLATNFLRTMSSSEDPCTAILEKGRTASDPIDALMKSLQSTSKP